MATVRPSRSRVAVGPHLVEWIELASTLRLGDPGVAARVRRSVRSALGELPSTARVEVWNGHVALRGEVPSARDVEMAGAAAASARGAKRVDNFLRVA